ncbi:MAG: hypothetical protein JST36_10180 [Bacteroidetes bacterium]|nr:hypothetical protein [Bacteroidota bacterium]
MKEFLAFLLCLCAVTVTAQTEYTLDSGKVQTVRGLGGEVQVAYNFAKGDVVTIEAHASKQLERMLVFGMPSKIIARSKYTKHPQCSFTMAEDNIVIFRFISDRGGVNTISYVVKRKPASPATQDYNTKVDWKTNSEHGLASPVPAAEGK